VLGVSIGIVLADLQLSKYWSNICHPMGGPYLKESLSRAVTTHNINKQRPAASARELFSQSPISPYSEPYNTQQLRSRNYTVCINNL